MFPHREDGLRVEVSEDRRHVLMTLDTDHAEQLAKFISLLGATSDPHDAGLRLAREAAQDTWLGAMVRLVSCAQNLRRQPVVSAGS